MARVWESLRGRSLEPYEHMAMALHESECIPVIHWSEKVEGLSVQSRYMEYRWCDHSEDHNLQAQKVFSSLYLQRESKRG